MESFRRSVATNLRHAVVLWLLFASLFARGMLPAGTMLSFNGQHLDVVLCNAQAGHAALQIDLATGASTHADSCPFALALSMAGVASAAIPLLTFAYAQHHAVTPETLAAAVSFLSPYPARGPPHD